MHALALLTVVAATLGQPPLELRGPSPEFQLSLDPPRSLQLEADEGAPARWVEPVQTGAAEEAPAVQSKDRRSLAGKLFVVSALALAGAFVAPHVLIDRSDTADQGGMAATVIIQVELFGAAGLAAALGIYHLAKSE